MCQMSTKKRKRKSSMHKVRMFFAFIIFGGITAVLGYNLFNNLMLIREMKVEKKELKIKISDLEKEKQVLETDIMKLEDPDYIAKYVREKYYYSKNGEVILRID